MKSKLKAPGTEHLKLRYDNLVSRFAFKLNLRRYNQAFQAVGPDHLISHFPSTDQPSHVVLTETVELVHLFVYYSMRSTVPLEGRIQALTYRPSRSSLKPLELSHLNTFTLRMVTLS